MQYYSYTDMYEIAHESGIARKDPLEPDRFLLPSKATFTAPGTAKEGYAQVWKPISVPTDFPYAVPFDVASSGVDGDWIYVEDHRQTMATDGTLSGGTAYWLPNEGDKHGSPARYTAELGPLPEGALTAQPAATTAELFATLRTARDARLTDTDKCLLPDYPITADALEKVKTYRAALRDLPAQAGAPWDGGCELTPWPAMPKVG